METGSVGGCALHGNGVHPALLVGRRLESVAASWHLHGEEGPSGPLDVWLIDGEGDSTRVTTGSDWCLVVETASPFEGYDMGEYGRVAVVRADVGTPFATHTGETVLAVREERQPHGGRRSLEVVFASGTVRCESRSGDLRLSAG
jgi:hypothetical protein